MVCRVVVVLAFVSLVHVVSSRHHGYHHHGSSFTRYNHPRKTVTVETVPRRPKLNEEQINLFLDRQQSTLLEMAKKINTDVEDVCRLNQPVLTPAQKRDCSCVFLFSFLHGGPEEYERVHLLYEELLEELHNLNKPYGLHMMCYKRTPHSPLELHNLCHCLVGEPLG